MEKEIVEKIIRYCPKAFSNLVDYLKSTGDLFNEPFVQGTSIELFQKMLMINSVPRYLYDFFDHHKIFLKVFPVVPNGYWGWCVQNEQLKNVAEGSGKHNRPDTEGWAFESAFKILESKL